MTLQEGYRRLRDLGMVALLYWPDHLCYQEGAHGLAQCSLAPWLYWTATDLAPLVDSDDLYSLLAAKLAAYGDGRSRRAPAR